MPRPRKPIPTVRNHKGSAVVEVYDGALRQMITLGPWGSDEANDEYQRLLARQRAGRSPATGAKPADDLSVCRAAEVPLPGPAHAAALVCAQAACAPCRA